MVKLDRLHLGVAVVCMQRHGSWNLQHLCKQVHLLLKLLTLDVETVKAHCLRAA